MQSAQRAGKRSGMYISTCLRSCPPLRMRMSLPDRIAIFPALGISVRCACAIPFPSSAPKLDFSLNPNRLLTPCRCRSPHEARPPEEEASPRSALKRDHMRAPNSEMAVPCHRQFCTTMMLRASALKQHPLPASSGTSLR